MNDKMINDIAETTVKMLNGVTTVADTKGISARELEAVYNVGYMYYKTAKYDEAEKIFFFLTAIEHTSSKYWTALGAVRQAQKNYDKAIEAYAAASMFDSTLPKPHYYAAECLMMKGDLDGAESGVRSVLALCPAGSEINNKFRVKAEKLGAAIKALREKLNA